jgi:hypothetical protein
LFVVGEAWGYPGESRDGVRGTFVPWRTPSLLILLPFLLPRGTFVPGGPCGPLPPRLPLILLPFVAAAWSMWTMWSTAATAAVDLAALLAAAWTIWSMWAIWPTAATAIDLAAFLVAAWPIWAMVSAINFPRAEVLGPCSWQAVPTWPLLPRPTPPPVWLALAPRRSWPRCLRSAFGNCRSVRGWSHA